MLKITLVKSVIGAKPVNQKTVKALGLRKTGRTVYRDDSPSVRGMIRNVQHLLKVESVDAAPEKAAKPKKPAAPKPEPKQEAAPVAVAAPAAPKPAKKPAAKKPAAKPAAKKPAAKTAAKPAGRKPETDRKAFGEIGKKKKES